MKHNITKRLGALVLCLCLLIGAMPLSASAAEAGGGDRAGDASHSRDQRGRGDLHQAGPR